MDILSNAIDALEETAERGQRLELHYRRGELAPTVLPKRKEVWMFWRDRLLSCQSPVRSE